MTDSMKMFFELSKLIIGISAIGGFFFYEGKRDEMMDNHETRIENIEAWKDAIGNKAEGLAGKEKIAQYPTTIVCDEPKEKMSLK